MLSHYENFLKHPFMLGLPILSIVSAHFFGLYHLFYVYGLYYKTTPNLFLVIVSVLILFSWIHFNFKTLGNDRKNSGIFIFIFVILPFTNSFVEISVLPGAENISFVTMYLMITISLFDKVLAFKFEKDK